MMCMFFFILACAGAVFAYIFYDVHANYYKVEGKIVEIDERWETAQVKFISPIDNKEKEARLHFGSLPEIGDVNTYMISKDVCYGYSDKNKTRDPDFSKPIKHCGFVEYLPY